MTPSYYKMGQEEPVLTIEDHDHVRYFKRGVTKTLPETRLEPKLSAVDLLVQLERGQIDALEFSIAAESIGAAEWVQSVDARQACFVKTDKRDRWPIEWDFVISMAALVVMFLVMMLMLVFHG